MWVNAWCGVVDVGECMAVSVSLFFSAGHHCLPQHLSSLYAYLPLFPSTPPHQLLKRYRELQATHKELTGQQQQQQQQQTEEEQRLKEQLAAAEAAAAEAAATAGAATAAGDKADEVLSGMQQQQQVLEEQVRGY